MDILKIYSVELKFKVPNFTGMNLNFQTKVNDIIYAAQEFNENFDFKSIKITSVEEKSIKMLFQINLANENVDVNARDLTVFSKRLYHEREWHIYSREESKLFTAIKFEDITDEMEKDYDSIPEFPETIFHNIKLSIDENINEKMTDEKALIVFQSLLGVQDIGKEETKRFRQLSIKKIKTILLEGFE